MSAPDLVKSIQEKKGGNAASLGGGYVQVPRIPTGIFALDLAIGGGLPEGKVSIIYGTESSNKTNTYYRLVATNQHKPEYEGFYWVLIDLENSFDASWAKRMGVDLDRFIVTRPDTAEEAVDQVQAFMNSDDVVMVAVDSIAVMMTNNELQGSGDRAAVGGASILVQTLIKKSVAAMGSRAKTGRPPTLLLINQIRMKIGVMFGNPETIPGGNMQKFASSLTLRFYGKDEMDNEVSKDLPTYKHTNVIVKKNKLPLVSQKCEFKMRLLPTEDGGVGSSADWGTVHKYMKLYGLLTKPEKGTGWIMFGEKFANLDEVQETIYGDLENELNVKNAVIRETLLALHGPDVLEEDTDDDADEA